MSQKIRTDALFIDLDGTIVNSINAYKEAVKNGLASIGITKFNKRKVKEIAKNFELNQPLDPILKQLLQKNRKKSFTNQEISHYKNLFIKNYLRTYYAITMEKCKPFKNVHKTLRILSEHFPLILITMRFIPKEQALNELKYWSLHPFFREIITAKDAEKPKPSPDPLIESAKKLNLQLTKCSIVGDSIADIRAGKSAGIKTIGVLSGLYSKKELEKEKPDLILRNINQLPKHIYFPKNKQP